MYYFVRNLSSFLAPKGMKDYNNTKKSQRGKRNEHYDSF